MMRPLPILQLFWTLGISAFAGGDRPPNILFILTDDQSHRTVSSYEASYSWADTPNIDRLASEGVRFTRAYVGTWCMPARVSLMTGRYPHGVESIRMSGPYPGAVYDPVRAPFWPRVLRENGYTTAHIGKWHIGADTGFGRDWDYQASWTRPDPLKSGRPDGSYYYWDQKISFNGEPPRLTPGYATDNYTRWALDFIHGANRDPEKPWFLWLCYTAPHHPYIPADRHIGRFRDKPVPIPPDIFPPRPTKPEYMRELAEWVEGEDGRPRFAKKDGISLEDRVREYHETVCALDEGVGALIAGLKQSGQWDNTLIIFTSDQGYAVGQHGMTKKVAPYDDCIRGPLVVSFPGVFESGISVDAAVSGVDLVPTIFRTINMELNWPVDGRDLTPLLTRPDVQWDQPAFVSFTGWTFGNDTATIPDNGMDGHSIRSKVPWYVMLTWGRYKYVRYLTPGGEEEIYDLVEDPGEFVNLANRRGFAAIRARLRDRMMDELERTRAPFRDELRP